MLPGYLYKSMLYYLLIDDTYLFEYFISTRQGLNKVTHPESQRHRFVTKTSDSGDFTLTFSPPMSMETNDEL